MNEPSGDSVWKLSRWRVATVLAFVALNVAVYLVRIVSVWRYGKLFCSSGAEFVMIESVWKCMHNRPVYANPFSFPFSLSLYNYLFYDSYAGLLKLIGAWDAAMMTWGRQFTLLFALAAAVAQWRLVRSLLNLRGLNSALSFTLAVGLWLCTSLVKYWAVTIRPDMAAVALVMIALWVVVCQPRFAFVYAGVLLYLAWAFKQSVVLAFVALCLWLLMQKRWRALSIFVSVFAALVAGTLLIGSPEYRFNILVAPQMVKGFTFGLPWIAHAVGTGLNAALLNIYWVAAPFVLAFASGGTRKIDARLRPLLFVFIVALFVGIVGMGKIGGASNYLFEALAAGSTLLQVAVFTVPGKLLTSLLLLGSVQPALQLTGAAIGYHVTGKRDMAAIATTADYKNAAALRDRLAMMKKPIFTTDGPLALPWISTADNSPALTIDPNFHEAARSRDQNGSIEGMLQRGEIPTVVLAPSDTTYLDSLNASYKNVGDSMQQGVLYTIYEFNPGSTQH